MGVPITFLDKFNPDQFEIIGATESEGKGFSAGLWDADSGIAQPVVCGERKYKRLFIKHKRMYGIMGVPITFLDKYNPEQFEIIGIAKRGAGDPALKTKVYTRDDYPNYSDLNATPVIIQANGVPKNTYPRILIRRKIRK